MKLQYTMFPLKHSLLFNLKPIFIQYLSGTIKKKKKKKGKEIAANNRTSFHFKQQFSSSTNLFQQSRKRKQNVAQTCQATEFSLVSFEQPLAPQEE